MDCYRVCVQHSENKWRIQPEPPYERDGSKKPILYRRDIRLRDVDIESIERGESGHFRVYGQLNDGGDTAEIIGESPSAAADSPEQVEMEVYWSPDPPGTGQWVVMKDGAPSGIRYSHIDMRHVSLDPARDGKWHLVVRGTLSTQGFSANIMGI